MTGPKSVFDLPDNFNFDDIPLESQRILVVDDDKTILSLLGEFLESLDYQYRVAEDGVEALELLEQAPCTVVITDLLMPRMDGMELMPKIKERWPDTDIIVMTGYSRDFSYTDVIGAGASDFIQKPFNLNELEAKLNRVIRERALRAMLRRLSTRDGLTDLFNRRFFEQRLEEEVERASRQNYQLFLVMIDLDNFKEVNDELGHQAGDQVLKSLARVLQSSTRKYVDIPFRYGGDEFCVIVPQASKEQAEQIAERIRRNFFQEEGRHGTTLSIGVARYRKAHERMREDINILIHEADEAMYAAKKAGGNRVVVHGSVDG